MIKRQRLAGAALMGLAVGLGAPAAALAAPGDDARASVEEIIVTARKREERLQDVPASIAAASGETLAAQHIISVTELNSVAPGLTFATNPSRFGSGPALTLRGISTQAQTAAIQDSVGFVLDGVPVLRSKAAAFPDLSDVARVEVLRGPQGTLFGMNASAGVINLTTRDPTNVFEGEVKLGYSRYDNRTVNAALAGPITERLKGRISVFSKTRDGYVANIFDDSKWEGDKQIGGRAKLLFDGGSAGSFRLSADYAREKNDAGANVIRQFTPVTPAYVVTGLSSIVGLENDKINTKSLGSNVQVAGGAALQWDRPIGDHTLTSIAGYRRYTQDAHAGTYTWLTPANEGDQFVTSAVDQYSAETRIASPSGGRLDYVAGLFILQQDVVNTLLDPNTLSLPGGQRTSRNVDSDVKTLNYAAFAEANYKLVESFTLTGGLRWTHEKVDVAVIGLPIAPGLIRFGPPLGRSDDTDSVNRASWKIGAQWRPAKDVMVYATGSSGFKGPAFNTNPSVLGDLQQARPEVATSYEVGVKSQLFDRRLTLNASAFHANYKDFQAQGGLFLPGSIASTIVILNAGKLRTQGFEAEANWAVTPTTDLAANMTFIDAEFEEFQNAPCYPGQTAAITPSCGVNNLQDLSGTRMPNTPKWQANVAFRQRFTLPGSWSGDVAANYNWRSSIQWHNLGSPLGIEDGYGILGAAVSLTSPDNRVTLNVYGKNLTDQFHTSGISVGQQITHFLPVDYRRLFGVELTLRY
jgi:iron complex outermembrane receptor protein